MSFQSLVLMYGHDPDLLRTRRWVLEKTGYKVVTATALLRLHVWLRRARLIICALSYANPGGVRTRSRAGMYTLAKSSESISDFRAHELAELKL